MTDRISIQIPIFVATCQHGKKLLLVDSYYCQSCRGFMIVELAGAVKVSMTNEGTLYAESSITILENPPSV